jgi:hypothetical protein
MDVLMLTTDNCWTTRLDLQCLQWTFALSCSEIDMMTENAFPHFSHRYS